MSVQKPRILRTGETLEPISCEVTIATDALPTCKLTLADDPGVRMHELIEVFTAQGSQGIFRVTDRAKAYGGEITLEMRGAFDTLSDDIIAGRTELKGTPAAVLGTILAAQSTARWQLGTVAMTGAVKIKNDYRDLFELADSVRKDRSGYRWTFDYSTTPWTVNLVAMPADTVAEFRLGRNVASATIDLSDADMCTKLYMTVSTDSSSTLYTYENAAAQAEWGVIVKTVDVDADEVTDPAATGAAILAERAQPVAYITMDGYDLHKLTGDAYDRITLGSNCRVVLDGFAGTFIERVTKIKWPDAIGQPEKITVSLANNLTPFREQLNIMKKTGGGNSRAIEEQERELVRHRADIDTSNERILLWATAEEWDDIAEQYQTMGKSEFALTADQIQSTVLQTGITAGVATFDPTHTYAIGDKCIYNGTLYRFTSAHTGAWTGSDVATVSSQQSQISQNTHDITLKVSEGDVATQLSVECGNVSISGANLLVIDGYVTATAFSGLEAEFDNLTTGASEADFLKAKMATISGTFSIGSSGSFWMQGTQITKKSQSVVTSATVTMPSISRSNLYNFATCNVVGEVTGMQSGRIITSYTAGSASISSGTIYYLGYSGS